ncbi:MAG: hypothetical protein JNN12_04955 [Bacteroidetes Order II. Incertae sedis bacterium]|nr:hypothetical protein [Bacteroidetes Order II. bacterium]
MLQNFISHQLTKEESLDTQGGAAAAGMVQLNSRTTLEYHYYTPSIGYVNGQTVVAGGYDVDMWITRNGIRREIRSIRRISRLNERLSLGIPEAALV